MRFGGGTRPAFIVKFPCASNLRQTVRTPDYYCKYGHVTLDAPPPSSTILLEQWAGADLHVEGCVVHLQGEMEPQVLPPLEELYNI